MNNTKDTATSWPRIGGDLDAAISGAGGMEATDYALPPGLHPVLPVVPRSYQVEALTAWQRSHGSGVVVLPTGAGKTVVALMAIELLAAPSESSAAADVTCVT